MNYWPRDSAVYQWKEYNPSAIEQEFALMAKIGINTIRMFFMWDDVIGSELNGDYDAEFKKFLSKFQHFHDTAQKYHVYLNPTLFIGHMSGQDWFPSWFYVTKGQKSKADTSIPSQCIGLPPRKRQQGLVRDFYRDEEVYQFAFGQLERLLPRFKDSSTIQAWDLSNENQYMMPPRTPEEAQTYMKRMYEQIKSLDPNHPITIGMGKLSEMTGFNSFGPAGFNRFIDYYSVHTYPTFYYPPSLDIINFYTTYKPGFDIRMAQIAQKPIQFQEFGLSWKILSWRREKTRNFLMSGYFRIALWSSWLNGANAGALIWDFSDFIDPLRKREPYNHKFYEMFFGVVDKNYHLKPSAIELQNFGKFIAECEKIAPMQRFQPMQTGVGIVLPENFNELLRPVKSILELTDDTPIDVKKANRQSRDLEKDTLSNQNKALFSSYLWCRQANLEPRFISYDEDWTEYSLLFMPNLKSLSSKALDKINSYLKNGAKGKGGYIYVSSVESSISELKNVDITGFSPSNYRNASVSTKSISLKVNTDNKESPLISALNEICPILNLYHPQNHLDGISLENALYYDSQTSSAALAFFPARNSKGGVIWNTFVPEVMHTKLRNAYKKEQMWMVYHVIANWAGVESHIKCADPRLECSELVDPITHSKILVVLNHTKDCIHSDLEIMNPLHQITRVVIKLPGFGVHYQFL